MQRKILGGNLLVNERILEYPYIFQRMRPEGTVLDVGCSSSRLPIQLASLGYKVHGVDMLNYPFTHPNFTFHKEDIFEWKPEIKFEIVILLSTIEHFGLGVYGDEARKGDLDKLAVERITEWMETCGQLLVTTPFGKPRITPKHRIYDSERLAYLFPPEKFKHVDERYFERVGLHWIPASAEKLRNVDSPENPPKGVVVLDLKKL